MRSTVLALALSLTSMSLEAQWLHYPNAAIPRTADGTPNLRAPAPRTADGKPDLSGIWEAEHNRPCAPEGCPDAKIGQEFLDIGWSLKGGLPYQQWAADLVKKRVSENRKDDPNGYCLPRGIVRAHTAPLLRKILEMPGLVVILNEVNTTYRQIFTDGRPLPEIDQPAFDGYSVGKWDGDTLIVETTGFKDDTWLDGNGSPLTENGKVTERFRRVDYGKLEVEITVDDPKAYKTPWTVKLQQLLVPDTELLEWSCVENERDSSHLLGK